jgi:hypothetical protein
MGNTLSQFLPLAPKFTKKNVPDQAGKVREIRDDEDSVTVSTDVEQSNVN